MITFFLYGYIFTFDGSKIDGENKSLVDFYNLHLNIVGYLPIGHNLLNILNEVYPEEEFDFTNQDREKFFYILSTPESKNIPDNIIL